MKKQFRQVRAFAWFAALLLLGGCFLFAACKRDGGEGPAPDSTVEQTTEAKLVDRFAEKKDLGGRDFKLLTVDDYNSILHFTVNDASATEIEYSCYERTEFINDRYHINMVTVEVEKPQETLRNNEIAGIYEYDLVFPHPKDGIATLAASGCLADMNALTELHLDQDWWLQGLVKNYVTNGRLYYASSDAAIVSQALVGMIYNINLYRQFNYTEDLYQTVYAGDWTMEMLGQMVVDTDVSMDGAASANRTYGLIHHSSLTYCMTYAMEQPILQQNNDGSFTFAYDPERMTSIAEAAYDLFFTAEDNVLRGDSQNLDFGTSEIWMTFNSGRGLFMTFDIGQTYTHLRGLRFDIGYLPMPKLDTNQQEYHVFCGSGLFAIPAHAPSVSDSALVLEAYSIYSNEHVKPDFFEIIIGGRLSENPEDYEMLNFLHSIKYFDVGFTLDQDGEIFNMLHRAVFTYENPGMIPRLITQSKGAYEKIEELANNIS